MKILMAVILLGLMAVFGAGDGARSTKDPVQVNALPQPEENSRADDMEPYRVIECDDPQTAVDFLSEDAIQRCLAYHIFENPYDWELNIFQLPVEEERTEYFSSNTLCWHLIDRYYIYSLVENGNFEDNPIQSIRIVNDETRESVLIRPESFSGVLEALKQSQQDG